MFLLVLGAMLSNRFGFWFSAVKRPELPEIPTVNLEGSDPVIARRVREFREKLAGSIQSTENWGQYGMVLHAHGFASASNTCYGVAESLDPKNPQWPYLRGELFSSRIGNPQEALIYYQRAANLSSLDHLAQIRFADSLLELGRVDDAEQQYHKVLANEKQDPQALLGLAKVAVARRQYREALHRMRPIAENPRIQKTCYKLLASVYEHLGDLAAANLTRKRLAEMPPDAPRTDDPIKEVARLEVGVRAELAKAQALKEQERVDEMLALVEDAVHRYPDSFEAWDALSIACAMADDPTGAERAARKSIQIVPKNSNAWLGLGSIFIWQRKYQDALEPLRKSIKLDPQNRQAYKSLGRCLQELGDAVGAAEAYRLSGMEESQPGTTPVPVKEP